MIERMSSVETEAITHNEYTIFVVAVFVIVSLYIYFKFRVKGVEQTK